MESPDFETPEFVNFCEACFAIRRFKPSMTVSQLQTILTVAASSEPLRFLDVATAANLDYELAAHQIAHLAEGRRGGAGLKLLERLHGPDSRTKVVIASRSGKAVACRFALKQHREAALGLSEDERTQRLGDHLQQSVLPGVQTIAKLAPGLSLGTVCVLLYIGLNQKRFGYEGKTFQRITKSLGISNVARHLTILGEGNDKLDGMGLIEFFQRSDDKRKKFPRPSRTGMGLLVNLASALLREPAAMIKQPRAEAVEALASPEDVETLSDEDYVFLDPESLKDEKHEK